MDGCFFGGDGLAGKKVEENERGDEEIEGPERYEYRMIRDDTYKYVRFRNAPELFFDLSADPLETWNLVDHPEARGNETLEKLRALVAETMNFDEVDERHEEDVKLQKEYKLGTSKGDPNQYQFPDGRIINADSAITSPRDL